MSSNENKNNFNEEFGNIINDLRACSDSEIIFLPIESTDPLYQDFISLNPQPIFFENVVQKISSNSYTSFKQFDNDVQKIFRQERRLAKSNKKNPNLAARSRALNIVERYYNTRSSSLRQYPDMKISSHSPIPNENNEEPAQIEFKKNNENNNDRNNKDDINNNANVLQNDDFKNNLNNNENTETKQNQQSTSSFNKKHARTHEETSMAPPFRRARIDKENTSNKDDSLQFLEDEEIKNQDEKNKISPLTENYSNFNGKFANEKQEILETNDNNDDNDNNNDTDEAPLSQISTTISNKNFSTDFSVKSKHSPLKIYKVEYRNDTSANQPLEIEYIIAERLDEAVENFTKQKRGKYSIISAHLDDNE